ncbi:hypothetical protein B296_00004739 [Ensete ventricosum]|uniref:Uncharacterized protein n=1 Tax=Ensete ventricosum TaxID=4639 RepID=A0A427AFH2_ENSVE|nr:hypothetical protein B296_00004739 [Ensete ventricosum]
METSAGRKPYPKLSNSDGGLRSGPTSISSGARHRRFTTSLIPIRESSYSSDLCFQSPLSSLSTESLLLGFVFPIKDWTGDFDYLILLIAVPDEAGRSATRGSKSCELKSRLNTDLGQLRSDFKDLKTTLQKQQEEVTASLRNLGVLLNDAPETRAETECRNGKDGTGKVRASSLDNTKEIKLSDDSVVESSQKENNTK